MNIYLSNHPTQHNTQSSVFLFFVLFFSTPLSSQPELLASLQAPFISSHSKLKDSIRVPLLCQQETPSLLRWERTWQITSRAGPESGLIRRLESSRRRLTLSPSAFLLHLCVSVLRPLSWLRRLDQRRV